jgi:AbrB family looped-hinge helix DNA binding protein
VPTSTVTTKGQITLPRSVRQALGLDAGDKVDFVAVEGGFKLVPLRKDVRALKGRFAGRVKRPMTIEEMDEAIAQAAPKKSAGVIGLDTNVLVRFLAQDDPDQAVLATRIVEQELTDDAPGFIGLVVLVETTWVLQRLYRATPDEIREAVNDLLGSRSIVVEKRQVVVRTLATSEKIGCGFADALIAASALTAGCSKIVSFDRGAVRAGMTLVE